MYEQFFGLTERPFDLTPDWRYLYLTPMHREALSAMQYGVTSRKGIVVVVGEAGTGKTTVLRSALRALRSENVRHVYLNNPRLTRPEFLKFLAQAFKLNPESATCKVDLINDLTVRLTKLHEAGRVAVLVVDEAQSMPHDLLEEIRLLANIETDTAKLLQVVMLGQPELAARLNDPSLRQLKQRVAIRCTLRPLDLRSTAAMIAGRIRVAGGKPAEIFTPRAIELIFQYSGGIPRTINVICDNALLHGFATDVKPVGADIIEEVSREFDLTGVGAEGPLLEATGTGPLATSTSRPSPEPHAGEQPPPAAALDATDHERIAPADLRLALVDAASADGAASVPLIAAPSPPKAPPHKGAFSTFGKRRRFPFLSWVRG